MTKSSPALKAAKKRYYEKNKAAHREYDKITYKPINIKIKRDETDVIAFLDQQPNKSGYILNLIKEDMKKGGHN